METKQQITNTSVGKCVSFWTPANNWDNKGEIVAVTPCEQYALIENADLPDCEVAWCFKIHVKNIRIPTVYVGVGYCPVTYRVVAGEAKDNAKCAENSYKKHCPNTPLNQIVKITQL